MIRVVICTGAFSKSLVKQIEGRFIPLETERGYHIEFIEKQQLLSRPTCLVESGMYLTPSAQSTSSCWNCGAWRLTF